MIEIAISYNTLINIAYITIITMMMSIVIAFVYLMIAKEHKENEEQNEYDIFTR